MQPFKEVLLVEVVELIFCSWIKSSKDTLFEFLSANDIAVLYSR